jgi:rare lipoprotein A
MKRLVLIIVLLFLASCASSPRTQYKPRSGGEYVTASWYGSDFHGRPTSSGERYDMYGMTAAHKTMKFGTKLLVTNPDTGRSAVVTVNDRGPFVRGRDLDLSYGAARKIGLEEKGVGRVKIEYLGRDTRYVKRMPFEPAAVSGIVTVQIGSFKEETNATRLKQGLDFNYRDVHVTTAYVNGQKYYRVRIGRFQDYDSAYALAEKLADEGYSTLITSRN